MSPAQQPGLRASSQGQIFGELSLPAMPWRGAFEWHEGIQGFTTGKGPKVSPGCPQSLEWLSASIYVQEWDPDPLTVQEATEHTCARCALCTRLRDRLICPCPGLERKRPTQALTLGRLC